MRRKKLTPLVFIVIVAAASLIGVLASDTSPQLGLDLQGGVSVVLQPTKKASDEALSQTIEIIRSRVDALGVAEPEIARQGRSIVVQLPGVKNQQRALELVGDTAELRFRPVLGSIPGSIEDLLSSTTTTAAGASTTTTAAGATTSTTAATDVTGQSASAGATPFQDASSTTTAPTTTTTAAPGGTTTTTAPITGFELTPRDKDVADQPVVLAEYDTTGAITATYRLGPSEATGKIVSTAAAELSQNGEWSVRLEIKGGSGIEAFNAIAGKCFAKDPICPEGQLAIVLDSRVQSAPTIQQPSFKRDEIQITGSFSQSEAKDLALVLRYGSLPVNLEAQTVQTVSPTLGKDSLRAGLAAGLLGLVLVCLYMILYYRALGFVVVLGLGVWSTLNYAIISKLGVALSLAGVTGIVVSVGVTVDSYVVYFERLKDDLRAGRTLRTSTERSFARAFRTILAADISSFIGAALLFWLTVGPVRGFAFFLGLSTILDVVVAWFFTRPMVGLLSRNKVFTEARWFGVARGLAAPRPSATAPAGGAR
ncbi:MAG: protein translocase subunit SecD [Microthrixaceae bacterium]